MDQQADRIFRDRVFFIGLRFGHHARHSGYEAFGRYIGTPLPAPVDYRWTYHKWGKWGYPLNTQVVRWSGHPWYSLGANLTEWAALRHMLLHRRRLYHLLYADSDLWLLRRAHRFTRNHLVASFHQPTDQLRGLGAIERVARHLDGAILVCNDQRAYFEEFLPADRVFVVPHGVDSEFFRPPAQPRTEPVCITIGAHLRDFETLLQAMRIVWAENPATRFINVGTRSDKKFVFPPFEDPRVQFLDRVSDEALRAALQTARVAVFSFAAATANNAVLEAMASGLPIVTTAVGGVRDYVDDAVGVLCPPRDPEALAGGIIDLLRDDATLEKKAEAGRARALRLDYRIMAEQMGQVYRKILG